MADRKTLSDKGVAALRARAKRYALPDPALRGHYVRVTPNGQRSFVAVARSPAGKQIWTTIGDSGVFKIDDARNQAREIIKRIRAGLPPIEAKTESVADVAASWVKRHVDPNGLRSRREIVRMLESHILPAWRDRDFVAVKRSDVAKLLDHVEDKHGARAADYVLNVVRSIANWYAARTDDYVPPIARGMRRQAPSEQARARILDDDEIRLIWQLTESAGAFGAIVRLALLTAQRRSKIAEMKWADVSVDGEWTVPQEAREKGGGGVLQLPEAARAIIQAQARVGHNPHVFAGRGISGPFKGLGQAKAVLDSKLPPNMPGWTLHDLRRTARSLMSRAGVRPDVAERVLGHAIPGVGGVYDRHQYAAEKAEALRSLATLIESITAPARNVRRFRKAAR
jgi:integrase